MAMEAQILDADCVQVSTGDPAWCAKLRSGASIYLEHSCAREYSRHKCVREAVYVTRLWCRTTTGLSLCVVIADAWNTSYRRLHLGGDFGSLTKRLQCELSAAARGVSTLSEISVVRKKTTNGFHVDSSTCQSIFFPWLRIKVASAFLKRELNAVLARKESKYCMPETAENKVEVHAQTLETLNLRPGSWLQLSEDASGRVREAGRVLCDLHVQILHNEIKPSCSNRDVQIAPLRVLSWDIEAYSPSYAFPEASNSEDCIIAIGVALRTFYHLAGECDSRYVVATLGDVDPEIGEAEEFPVDFIECSDECALIKKFMQIVAESNADVVVGYNTNRFDWSYVRDRLNLLVDTGRLTAEEAAASYTLGRLRSEVCIPQDKVFESSALGSNPLCYPRTPGRIGIDLWYYLKGEDPTGLPNLKLDTVAAHYLKDTKVDLTPKQMFAAYEQGARGRRQVAVYCAKDCILVLDLLYKLNVIPRLLEMGKITGTIPEDLLYRGQQLKVYTQLLIAAHESGEYVVEDIESNQDSLDLESKYHGAHVEDPHAGYYTDPIITVDFASLYPSLMRTYNLSPDTLLSSKYCDNHEKVPKCSVCVHADRASLQFVTPSHCRGLLPKILDTLTQERKKAKVAMEKEECAFRRSILNAKQLALKISANSVYGACGASRGALQCRDVAEATTAMGRDIIAYSKLCIESEYQAVEGCTVVYGDTDSAFVRLPEISRDLPPDKLFDIGIDMAKFVTEKIEKEHLPAELRSTCVILLEMEKYLKPLILYKKKRYVGIAYESAGDAGKTMVRGLELVRKDGAPVVKECQRRVVAALLQDKSAAKAIEAVLASMHSVLDIRPGGPFASLTMSKSLKRGYANPDAMVHVKVAQLMNERNPGSAPREGDRVEYVIIASESPRVVDRVDSAEHAQLSNLPPDWHFYIDALQKTLIRTLEVPIRYLDCNLYEDFVNKISKYKAEALRKRREYSMVRHGAIWINGHACKTGAPQHKLTTFFPKCPPPTASSDSVDLSGSAECTSSERPVAASKASRAPPLTKPPEFVDTRTKVGRGKRGALGQMEVSQATRLRQSLLKPTSCDL